MLSYLPSSSVGDDGYLLLGSLKDNTPDTCILVKYNFVTKEYYPIVSFATNYLVNRTYWVKINNIIEIVYKDINTDKWNIIKVFGKQVLIHYPIGGDENVDNWFNRIYSLWEFKEYYGKLYVQANHSSYKIVEKINLFEKIVNDEGIYYCTLYKNKIKLFHINTKKMTNKKIEEILISKKMPTYIDYLGLNILSKNIMAIWYTYDEHKTELFIIDSETKKELHHISLNATLTTCFLLKNKYYFSLTYNSNSNKKISIQLDNMVLHTEELKQDLGRLFSLDSLPSKGVITIK